MAGSLSDYAELKLLDHVHGKTSFTMPANVYLALCTVTITEAMTGSTVTEASFTGYSRKVVAAADFNSAASGSITTNADETFAYTSGSSTITGAALCDNSATGAGNMLTYFNFAASKTIDSSNQPPVVSSGNYTCTLD